MIKIKHLPNLLTTLRIVLCAPLLVIEPLSFWFFILYVVCGISDVLDGYIARKTGCTSEFGAKFDSIADALIVGVLLYVFMPIVAIPHWMLIWIINITVIKLATLIIGYYRYRAFSFLHTYANKATGIMLFLVPFLLCFSDIFVTGGVMCAVASLSALEELLIIISSKELTRDVKSIFVK